MLYKKRIIIHISFYLLSITITTIITMTRNSLKRKCRNNKNANTIKNPYLKKEKEEEEEKSYNEKKLTNDKTALFFNYIKGCEKDIINLQKKLKFFGFKCIDIELNNINDFHKQLQKRIKRKISGIIIIFFFGYGYHNEYYEYIYLGSSAKESISYRVFYDKLLDFIEDNETIVLFTNTCFKKPKAETLHIRMTVDFEEDFEKEEQEKDSYFEIQKNYIYHFFTRIDGTCKRGSLLTRVFLNNIKEKEELEKFSEKICSEIDGKTWNNDKYYCSYIYSDD